MHDKLPCAIYSVRNLVNVPRFVMLSQSNVTYRASLPSADLDGCEITSLSHIRDSLDQRAQGLSTRHAVLDIRHQTTNLKIPEKEPLRKVQAIGLRASSLHGKIQREDSHSVIIRTVISTIYRYSTFNKL